MHSPTHQVQYKKPGASCYDFWFPVSCEKTTPPPYTHKDTHELRRSSHTRQSRAGISSLYRNQSLLGWVLKHALLPNKGQTNTFTYFVSDNTHSDHVVVSVALLQTTAAM